MLNFRFHIVSLVAVFLALAIGIIMGSTVIDRALVDTLEDQQQSLRATLDDITEDNVSLRQELRTMREGSERLASEGGERLLAGTLADVPVLVVAVRGVESSLLDDLTDLLATAGARDQGTLWLTDRLAVDDDGELADLAEVLGVAGDAAPAEDPRDSADDLRALAVEDVAAAVRGAVDDAAADGDRPAGADGGAAGGPGAGGLAGVDDGAGGAAGGDDVGRPPAQGGATDGPDGQERSDGQALQVLQVLRSAGFVEYDAPEGGADDVAALAVPGTRVVLVSGSTADVADGVLAVPLARALVARGGTGDPAVDLLAAEALGPVGEDGEPPQPAVFVGVLREEDVGDRLSTVDNLDAFAGRLAAVIAVQDLGAGRRGHYGVGPGAQRLVPGPAG